MTLRERQYYRLKAAVQELSSLSDEDLSSVKEVGEAISVIAKLILHFRENGVSKMRDEVRARLLKELGVATLTPKKR